MHIRVAIADDHPIVRLAVTQSLAHPAIEVVGEAGDVDGLLALLDDHLCDVVVVDLIMPGTHSGDGVELIETLASRYRNLRPVVLTGLDATSIVRRLEMLGACWVVSKKDALSCVVTAVFAAYAGRSYLSPSVPARQKGSGRLSVLSPREAQVLRKFASGASVSAIAEELCRSKQAVSTHKNSAMRKLGLSSDAELYRFADELGLTDEAPSS